ncbi:MAG: 16S rRNA (cytidine(1402)-2'-O)-methyltransferase [Fimbriimonadaceae bacterium]|nr:16S rRNA (cytidine(1402)-2'-O)-methyltransferase [Fimbriimonadaceae bacterium]
MAGRLYVVAGPIGNLNDFSPRAQKALEECDLVLAEDTRVTGKLLHAFEISKPMATLSEHTQEAKIRSYLERLESGETVALLTDAGTPAISDPGSQLVDLALDSEVEVVPIPGPSAVSTALSASGFFAQRYAFLGFLPRKPGPAAKVIEPFVDSTFTLVFFESPHRFLKTLEICGRVLGSRRYAITRELTKLHEQIFRGALPDLPSDKQVPPKGEFTIVIEGSRKQEIN